MMMTMSSSSSSSTHGKLAQQLSKFYAERVQSRRASVGRNVRDVCAIVADVLKEVETQEPRFVSSLSELNGHYDGLQVDSYSHDYQHWRRSLAAARPLFGSCGPPLSLARPHRLDPLAGVRGEGRDRRKGQGGRGGMGKGGIDLSLARPLFWVM